MNDNLRVAGRTGHQGKTVNGKQTVRERKRNEKKTERKEHKTFFFIKYERTQNNWNIQQQGRNPFQAGLPLNTGRGAAEK